MLHKKDDPPGKRNSAIHLVYAPYALSWKKEKKKKKHLSLNFTTVKSLQAKTNVAVIAKAAFSVSTLSETKGLKRKQN